MRVSAGDWCYSLDHDEPGRVIAVDVVWGEETAQVWLARRDAVVRLHRSRQIGTLAAIYPAVWGLAQLVTGAWSDRIGRKGLIVAGMWTQAAGIVVIALGSSFAVFATGAVLLGLGTAMVYPTRR